MTENLKKPMTLSEAADYLGLSKSCLYKKTHRRELPFFKPGNKKIYFKKDDLEAFAFSNRQPSRDEIGDSVNELLNKRR